MWRSRPDMREQYILYMSLGSLLKQGSTMSQDLSRRKMIAALGIGAVGAVAGCIGAPVNAETPPPEDETEDVVAELDPAREVDVDWIAADPTDVPAPVDWDEPREHDVTLRTKELVAEVEPGVTFKYMTFEGRSPGR